ncbi:MULTISPECIES: hypothetical protein [unclassified Pseudofrankia]|uniref:hypothetical protein n=1 Tax=unclassified Pseudofrankia TaxID=2994372 RepID=UPI0008D9BF2A|nr:MULTISPECIES: hypothetical protein [unclassified Pseudofrankia]MDT3446931.1 hypothetical protein [Pseudofrankia sp. BMG5.37]OHV73958.1 hypothetical protein BCD48_32980 [Pseudofrankia sp. BMG5.36]
MHGRARHASECGGYARRYGVDRYTAYDDLTSLGVELPDTARRWAQRPAATPRRRAERRDDEWPHDDSWITLDGHPYFVAGYTAGGAPYGIFADNAPEGIHTAGPGN